MTNTDWLKELEMFGLRYSHLGINTDLATLSLFELWGLYCYLSRIAEG